MTAGPWSVVMTRAGEQCERTRTVRGVITRCMHTRGLVVAPADPAVPEHAAWRVPVEGLAAWCSPCLSDARRRASLALARRRGIPGQMDLLAAIPGDMSEVGDTVTVTPDGGVIGNE